MKKIIYSLCLISIIAVSSAYVYFKIASIGPEDNYFNSHWRYGFSRYPILREAFALHYDGDTRYDYLGKESKEIKLEVIPMEGISLSHDILQNLSDKIQTATGKPVNYFYSSFQIPSKKSLNLKDLTSEADRYRVIQGSPDAAVAYIVAASALEGEPDRLGSTLEEDGIVIFLQTLQNYTDANESGVFNRFAASILLHEFGHQIGLDHNDIAGCLMNETSEFGGNREIVDDFCEEERKQIKEMRY